MISLQSSSCFHLVIYSPSYVVRKLLTQSFTRIPSLRTTCIDEVKELYGKDLLIHGGILDETDAGVTFPALYLTSQASVKEGLVKPFSLERLMDTAFQFFGFQHVTLGPYLFNPFERLLKKNDGSVLTLREKEGEILRFLYKNPSHYATRSDLLHELWGYSKDIETHTLETHIYHLRQKIEIDPSNPRLLVNLHGGYKLVLD